VPVATWVTCASCSTDPPRRDEHLHDDQRDRAWLWGLYLALADEQGVDASRLQGTTQNDIVKEYLSRGTFIFAPSPPSASPST